MALDKIIAFESSVSNLTTAGDTNWAQRNVTVMDNSSGVVPKNIKTLFLNGVFKAGVADKYWAAILVVTAKDGAVPDFTGSDTDFNVDLEKYKDIIWATQFGYCINADAESETKALCMEPSTGRTLEPGQKLVLCLLARNPSGASGSALYYIVDWNIWFTYG